MRNRKILLINLLLIIAFSIYVISLGTSCDNDSNAQENQIAYTETYSGSFATASTLTDSNDDGKPANLGEFEGSSTFGSVVIQSLNEFEKAENNDNCDPGELKFTLVRGTCMLQIQFGTSKQFNRMGKA